jgi:23S rRNA (adenine2503-C2)-methyltransferase
LNKRSLKDYTLPELTKLFKHEDIEPYRAKQVFEGIHLHLAENIEDIKNIPNSLKEKLKEEFEVGNLKCLHVDDSIKYATKKFLFETEDGNKIETVLISEDGRDTICVSTQVGCNVGCEFCATGKMGFSKNLKPGEIVDQVYNVWKITGVKPSNLVYMGMGEPFLNYDNMLKSLLILTSKHGINLSSRKITVSTVGFKNKIKKFADDLMHSENKSIKNVKLALSLHSTDNGIREAIIPTSKKNTLSEIYEELIYFYRTTGNKITYEYIFFEGLNDTENDVKRLTKLSGMIPSNINIIPFHPISFKLNKPLDIFNEKKDAISSSKDIDKFLSKNKLFDFIERLRKNKVVVNLRSSSGVDINAACGQLAVMSS